MQPRVLYHVCPGSESQTCPYGRSLFRVTTEVCVTGDTGDPVSDHHSSTCTNRITRARNSSAILGEKPRPRRLGAPVQQPCNICRKLPQQMGTDLPGSRLETCLCSGVCTTPVLLTQGPPFHLNCRSYSKTSFPV